MEIIPLRMNTLPQPTGMILPMPIMAPSVFSRELTKCADRRRSADRLDLKILTEKLEDAGEALEESPSMANFLAFRELIGNFAQLATSLAYRIENTGGQWPHEYVAVVNREADLLYHLIMQKQLNRVSIASRIASIKGMIIRFTA